MAAKIYCVEGTDSFQIKQFVEQIKKQFIENEVFNYDQLSDGDLNKAINSLAMIPFFGDFRLVHLVNPLYLRATKAKLTKDELLAANPDFAKELLNFFVVEDDQSVKVIDNKLAQLEVSFPEIAKLLQGDQSNLDKLLTTINNADEKVILLISCNEGLFDKRKKIVKEIKKQAVKWQTFEKVTATNFNLTQWLQQMAAKFDCQFDNQALQILNALGGRDLEALANEVNKFATFVGDKKIIAAEDVKQLLSYDELADFEIANAVRQRDKKKLITLVYKTIKDDYGILLQTVGSIAHQIRTFLKVKTLYQSGVKNAYEIGKQIGLHHYPVTMIINDLNKYSLEELKKILIALHQLDYNIKSGQADSLLLLELTLSKYF